MARPLEEDRARGAPAYLTARELCRRWGISRATLSRYRAAGFAPRAVLLGPRTLRWPLADVERFEAQLARDRGGPAPQGDADAAR